MICADNANINKIMNISPKNSIVLIQTHVSQLIYVPVQYQR